MSDWKRIEDPVADGVSREKDKPTAIESEAAEPKAEEAASAEPEIVASEKPTENASSGQETALPESTSPVSAAGGTDSGKTTSGGNVSFKSSPEKLPASSENMEEPETVPVIRSPRYTKTGRRKGRRWYAAPLGLLVLLLAVVGLVSLIVGGIGAIQKARDDTPLREELESFLSPIMQYCPSAFSDINDNPQDTLLLAAIWRVSKAEQVRMLRENTEESIYTPDEFWRLMIPVSEIEDSYHYLYGPDAVPVHRSIDEGGEDFSIEYDEENNCYHVPLMTDVSSNYTPVFDTVQRKGDTVTIRVAYVSNTDIAIDDNGDPITPSPDQARYAQIYTVVKNGDGWALISIADE